MHARFLDVVKSSDVSQMGRCGGGAIHEPMAVRLDIDSVGRFLQDDILDLSHYQGSKTGEQRYIVHLFHS